MAGPLFARPAGCPKGQSGSAPFDDGGRLPVL